MTCTWITTPREAGSVGRVRAKQRTVLTAYGLSLEGSALTHAHHRHKMRFSFDRDPARRFPPTASMLPLPARIPASLLSSCAVTASRGCSVLFMAAPIRAPLGGITQGARVGVCTEYAVCWGTPECWKQPPHGRPSSHINNPTHMYSCEFTMRRSRAILGEYRVSDWAWRNGTMSLAL